MRWLVAPLCLTVGCDSVRGLFRDNAPEHLRQYTTLVARDAGAELTVRECQMYPGVRGGYCVVQGPEPELRKLPRHYRLKVEEGRRWIGHGCHQLEQLGRQLTSEEARELGKAGENDLGWVLREGAESWGRLGDNKPFPSSASVFGREPDPEGKSSIFFKGILFMPSEGVGCIDYNYPAGE